MKKAIFIGGIFILSISVIIGINLVKSVWSQEANVISEEKKEALEDGRKGKREKTEQGEPKSPVVTPAGPLTPETKERYKSSLPSRLEFIKNNMNKNDKSISLTLETLNFMLKPGEMLSLAPDILEVLLEVAEKHRVTSVRLKALNQLVYLGDKAAIPRLKVALDNEKEIWVRILIAKTLIVCGEKEVAFSVLANAALKKDIYIWEVDTTGMWSALSHGSLERGKMTEEVKQRHIPVYALETLAKIGNVEANSVIREALNDKNPYVRFTAARILVKFDEKSRAFPVIAEIARDTNVNNLTRTSAIEILRQMGETYILRGLLTDENKYIRQKAKEALEKIR